MFKTVVPKNVIDMVQKQFPQLSGDDLLKMAEEISVFIAAQQYVEGKGMKTNRSTETNAVSTPTGFLLSIRTGQEAWWVEVNTTTWPFQCHSGRMN